ncbi:MAG: hypothetical protein LBH55_00465 [Mycoplasmataceae bacterium]|nr:hypothetical protein [Mycoplasmataceae bacterium]
MTFTFGEAVLLERVLSGNFKLSDLTPELFFECTKGNTRYSYSDFYAMLANQHIIANPKSTVPMPGSSSQVVFKPNKELQKVYTAVKEFLDAVDENIDPKKDTEVDRIQRASRYYASEITKVADRKTIAERALEEVKNGIVDSPSLNITHVISSTGETKYYPKVLGNLLNASKALHTAYTYTRVNLHEFNPKSSDVKKILKQKDVITPAATEVVEGFEQTPKSISAKSNVKAAITARKARHCCTQVEKKFYAERIKKSLEYKNFFNYFSTPLTTKNADEYIPGKVFIKAYDANGVTLTVPDRKTAGGQRFNPHKPINGLLNEMLSGNGETYCAGMPIPHFDKAGHFMKFSPVSKDNQKNMYLSTDDTAVPASIATYLESKGFQVEKKTIEGKQAYSLSDLVDNGWDSMEENDKIDAIKSSLSLVVSTFANSYASTKAVFQRFENRASADTDMVDLDVHGFITAQASTIASTRNMLAYLYVGETNPDIKATIETSILTLKVCADKIMGDEKLLKHERENMLTGNDLSAITNKKCYDEKMGLLQIFNENQPFHLLNATKNLEKAKLGAEQYFNQALAFAVNVDSVTVKDLVVNPYTGAKDQLTHLKRNKLMAFINKKEIKHLEFKCKTLEPAIEMYNSLYDENGTLVKEPMKNGKQMLYAKIKDASEKPEEYCPEMNDDAAIARHANANGTFKSNNNLLNRIKRKLAIIKHCKATGDKPAIFRNGVEEAKQVESAVQHDVDSETSSES